MSEGPMFRDCKFFNPGGEMTCPMCGERVPFLHGDGDLWSSAEPAHGLFLRCGACKALFDAVFQEENPPSP